MFPMISMWLKNKDRKLPADRTDINADLELY
jgi:hypothetical protein